MPRRARIDAPGALHHIIIRGIEKKTIFRDVQDKNNFVERLGRVLIETGTPCYAWALMPNHIHLLLRTGVLPISTVMRRLLTGYAQQFNRRHKRHGQLFQNRYKSILCEEEPYLLELVRYIHLNPFRTGLVGSLKSLKSYKHSGHGSLMGMILHEWQDHDYVLSLFAKREGSARMKYEEFVAEGLSQGRRPELIGGGLVRSAGGWSELKEYHRQGDRIKSDERILGSSDFVETVLKTAREEFEQSTRLKVRGIDFQEILKRVAEYYGIDAEDLKSGSKKRIVVEGRSVLCYLGVRKLKQTCTDVSLHLNIHPSAVSKSVDRGQVIVQQKKLEDRILK